MKYLNQLDYPTLPYPTDVSNPDSKFVHLFIKEAGCVQGLREEGGSVPGFICFSGGFAVTLPWRTR